MKTLRWTVAPSGPTAVTLAGPGLDDLLHDILDSLAESIHDGDRRARSWTDYLIASGNLNAADEEGVTDAERERLEDLRDVAWDALAAEFAATVRLHTVEARLIAGQLDEACGRIGTVAP